MYVASNEIVFHFVFASADVAYVTVKALIYAKNDMTRPLTRNVFALSDLKDHRAILFWLLQFTTMVSFALWLVVSTYLAGIHISYNPSATGRINKIPTGVCSAPSRESFSKQLSVDVWFSLSLPAAMDAISIVFTFNRALIRKFHYVVSQRMMFLASILSYAIYSWSKVSLAFVSRNLVKYLAIGLAVYMFLGFALDLFERRIYPHEVASRFGTLAQYSQELGHSESSWRCALFFSTIVAGFGVTLTMLIPSTWSAFVPVVHILFEVCRGRTINFRHYSSS